MNDKILVAVIAGFAALLGSLIPQVFTYMDNKDKRAAEAKLARQEQQSEVYEELLLALQRTMNEGPSGFESFQNAVLKVSLHGDASTAKSASNYYQTLVKRGNELKAQDHADYQREILNSMRSQLDLPTIEDFEIVRFSPPH